MKLSVVIVNYNVRYFLEQCLHSVKKASSNLMVEVFVVDNNSVDRSVEMVREKFPEVHVIANKENTGFSFANNQAIKQSTGEYVLLLNPDTVVEEDTFKKIITFMDEHPEAGGLGVKMIDGKGIFLPESKRGLPTPEVAFYKIFGLASIFPKSQRFGRYHLGYLDNDKINEVDVLSGAFMFMRKAVLDKVGLLDEDFFMYGEDIDLSYRIIKGGYKNYYFPQTRIIHYKGESTKKSSVNYVFVFYNAMVIFAKKHFSQKNARLFSALINCTIYLRASVAIINRFVRRLFLPVSDTLIIFFGIYFLKNYWETYVKAPQGLAYPPEFMHNLVPLLTFIWISSVFFNGGYDRPLSIIKLLRGVIIGSFMVLVIYSLLPEIYRYSRAIIILGSLWALIMLTLWRIVLNILFKEEFKLLNNLKRRVLIVGGKEEVQRVKSVLLQSQIETDFIGLVNSESDNNNTIFIGNIHQLKEMVQIHKIDEIIFCAKNISSQKIIDFMSKLGHTQVDYKIAPPESLYIIGSNSIDKNGDFYTVEINAINKQANQRNKRLIDIWASLVFIVTLPVLLIIVKNKAGLIKNIVLVLWGTKSWVGYFQSINTHSIETLPTIKKGVLSPYLILNLNQYDDELNKRLNLLYAKDYKPENDLKIILKGLKYLGR
ncbi:MAG: glycosyltransferase [Bacteroidia bacterium]|nr:glycosyltransferase [Bacteroidia bacterium]